MIRQRLLALSLAAVIAVGVIIAPGGTHKGSNCAKGVAGCHHGKFTGDFFGD
ncbi:MAG TPA: hypothetical protein VJL81_08935 [Solirubrobacterales bacterium]|nr:hypothetical protein [Solirubrobacterales bacterium]